MRQLYSRRAVTYRHGVADAAVLGFVTGLTLIAAIGAQNAFVLRQGIRGEHVAVVAGMCAAADVVLIAAGIAGVGALIAAHPQALTVVRIGGAAFLIGYGLLAARRALRPATLTPATDGPAQLAPVLGLGTPRKGFVERTLAWLEFRRQSLADAAAPAATA